MELSKQDKLKNIFAFLGILFADSYGARNPGEAIMQMSPDYLIEKWQRYMDSDRPEWEWGMHENLHVDFFDEYLEKWGIE